MADSEDDDFVSASEGEEDKEQLPLQKSRDEDERGKEENLTVLESIASSGDDPSIHANNVVLSQEHLAAENDRSDHEQTAEFEEGDAVSEQMQRACKMLFQSSSIKMTTNSEESAKFDTADGGEMCDGSTGGEESDASHHDDIISSPPLPSQQSAPNDEGEEEAETGEGWDDWGETQPEDLVVPNKLSLPEVPAKACPSEAWEEETDGWDEDWGHNDLPTTTTEVSNEKDEKAKSITDDAPLREQALGRLAALQSTNTNNDSSWGWSGMLSGLGDSLSSTIESSLGLPSASELARRHTEVERKNREDMVQAESTGEAEVPQKTHASFSGFGVFSGIVSGGIDVLETIGKKTFETITVREQDAGRRRFIFEADRGQNLSDVLKELREKEEAEAALAGSSWEKEVPRLPEVASSFERSDGMIHLEALEMVAAGTAKARTPKHRELLFVLESESTDAAEDDGRNFARDLEAAVKSTGLPYTCDAINRLDKELDGRVRRGDGAGAEELFKEGVNSIVQFTAAAVHLVSKLASLAAVMGGDSSFTPYLKTFRLLSQRCSHYGHLYMLAISATDSGVQGDELATQILVESSTAIQFIRQAHTLLIPIVDPSQ